MNLPKFIITMDGFLHLGMVNQHKDLLIGDDRTKEQNVWDEEW